jgi:hypothetical protein
MFFVYYFDISVPFFPFSILVSASDDGTLRVWGPSSDISSSEHDDALMEDLQLSDRTSRTKDSNGTERHRNGGS